MSKEEIIVGIILFLNSLITAIYLHNQNYLNDIIWCLPIVLTSTYFSLLLLKSKKEQEV